MSRLLRAWVIAFVFALAATAAAATPAAKYRFGIPNPSAVIPGTCAFGSAFADGCALANQNANFTVQSAFGQTFQAHAATSSQPWVSAHPWPFNAPGIDYPVGYDKGTVFKDWLTATMPIGCVRNASGNPFTGGPFISCTSGNPTFDGFDFTTGGGGQIRVTGTTGLVTLKNFKFTNGSNTNALSSYFISSGVGTTASLDMENGYLDGGNTTCTLTASYTSTTLTVTDGGTCGANVTLNKGQLLAGGTMTYGSTPTQLTSACTLSGGAASCAISNNLVTGGPSTITVGNADWEGEVSWDSTNCAITIKYNAFLNEPSLHGAWLGSGCTINVDYNYSDAMAVSTLSKVHVAYFATAPNAHTNVNLLDYSYNVGIYPNHGNGLGSTMFSILGVTSNYTGYVNAKVVGNISVTNLLASNGFLGTIGGASTSSGLFFINTPVGIFGNFEAHDNWVDPTGALGCFSNISNTTFTYFVDDGLGGGTYDGVDGNVLTVTDNRIANGTGQGAIYQGANVGNNAGVFGVIQTYGTVIPGTATPSTGTGLNAPASYVFSGTATHVPPSANAAGKSWDTPITTVGGTITAAAGNQMATNIRDGSAISMSGVQWNTGACNGHH